MRAHELFESIDSLEQQLQAKYPEIDTLLLSQSGDTIRLTSIIINKKARKEGVGTNVLNALTNYADTNKLRITLTPGQRDDRHGTTSTSRLIKFYKQFGFIENKGRHKDFTISDTMIREPN